MSPIMYKHTGSTYDEDGIRITGSKGFIDSLLSNLKSLLEYEGDSTRLQLTYQPTVDRETQLPTGTYNCYIQVHERGREAIICNKIINARRRKGK